MNDFTKEELKEIYEVFDRQGACRLLGLKSKIQSMIDNYCEDVWERKKIAESHLQEASSLISHAMCLLDMKDDDDNQ